ncbi:MAG: hypothetical protein V4594_04490 [Bacteroidota bacterium]
MNYCTMFANGLRANKLPMLILFIFSGFCRCSTEHGKEMFIIYEADLGEHEMRFYWKDPNNQRFGQISICKNGLKNTGRYYCLPPTGGMYDSSHSPQ